MAGFANVYHQVVKLARNTTNWFALRGALVRAASEPVQVAGLHWLGAGQEGLSEDARASRHRELAGVRIDVDEADAVGRLERYAGVSRQGAHHELGPDRQRRLRATQ